NAERHSPLPINGNVVSLASARNDIVSVPAKDGGNPVPGALLKPPAAPGGGYLGVTGNRLASGPLFASVFGDTRLHGGFCLDVVQASMISMRPDAVETAPLEQGAGAAPLGQVSPSATFTPEVSGLVSQAAVSDPAVLSTALAQFLDDLGSGTLKAPEASQGAR